MPHEMTRNLLLVLLGALLGGGLVWWALSPATGPLLSDSAAPLGAAASRAEIPARVSPTLDSSPGERVTADLRVQIQELRAALQQERDRGRDLAEILPYTLPEALPDPGMAAVAVTPGPETSPPAEDEAPPWFDGEALEGAGWTPGEIRRIRLRWEEYEMAKLEVENDRARKVPGWKHLGKRSFQIEAELRRDLGDENYGAMRYATSQPNRVILSELLGTSPAAAAGLEPGDEVISYDGQRIFTASALKYLTVADVPGALTEMRVLRAGEEHRFFVPRGPLGTRLEVTSRAPYPR
jgi:hypothetical protein